MKLFVFMCLFVINGIAKDSVRFNIAASTPSECDRILDSLADQLKESDLEKYIDKKFLGGHWGEGCSSSVHGCSAEFKIKDEYKGLNTLEYISLSKVKQTDKTDALKTCNTYKDLAIKNSYSGFFPVGISKTNKVLSKKLKSCQVYGFQFR